MLANKIILSIGAAAVANLTQISFREEFVQDPREHIIIVQDKLEPRIPLFLEQAPCAPVPCELVELPKVKPNTDLPSIAKEITAAHDSSARHDSVKPHVAPKIGCRNCNGEH